MEQEEAAGRLHQLADASNEAPGSPRQKPPPLPKQLVEGSNSESLRHSFLKNDSLSKPAPPASASPHRFHRDSRSSSPALPPQSHPSLSLPQQQQQQQQQQHLQQLQQQRLHFDDFTTRKRGRPTKNSGLLNPLEHAAALSGLSGLGGAGGNTGAPAGVNGFPPGVPFPFPHF